MPSAGYKKTEPNRERAAMDLAPHLDLRPVSPDVLRSEHSLDAAICVLAGHDFLAGRCIAPADGGLAGAEGWIWVREPTI